jgi:flagellar motor protein MotB
MLFQNGLSDSQNRTPRTHSVAISPANNVDLRKLPNTLAMEGHTDSKQYPGASNYGNWELSTDRANAARRLMTRHGIRQDQVTQVRGFADQRLRKKDAPSTPQIAGSR